MVMNFAVFDTNLHMTHHYKRIHSAKSVVNSFPPRNYQLKYNKSLSSTNSRYSSPTLLRIPSRTNSNCDDHRRKKSLISEMTDGRRSNSVPPRPGTRRNQKVVPQNYIKSSSPYPEIKDNNSNKIPLVKHSPNVSASNSPTNTKTSPIEISPNNCYNFCKEALKAPIPTPRTISPTKPAAIADYEYLQFSLRITEDIIRNDLYSQKEMRRVFNSHIEANRGRLDLKKMLLQIDHLCTELEISKKSSNLKTQSERSCQTSLDSKKSKETLINKIVNGEQITEEEIKKLTENELEDVISGVLNDKQENTSKTTSSLIEVSDIISQSTQQTVESSAKTISDRNCDVIHSNVQNFSCLSEEDLKTISSIQSSDVTIKDAKNEETEQQNIVYDEYENMKIVTKENKTQLALETTKEEIKSAEEIPTDIFEETPTDVFEEIPTDIFEEKPRSSIESYDEKLRAVLFNVPQIVQQQSETSKEQINTEEVIIDIRSIEEQIEKNNNADDIEENETIKSQLSTIEENESQRLVEEEETISRETIESKKGSLITIEQNQSSTISSMNETREDEVIEPEQLKIEAQVLTNEPIRKSSQEIKEIEENKEIEVSIVAQIIPVDTMDTTSASLNTVKSRNSESKTTQTLLTVDEKNKLIKTSISDYDKSDAINFAQSSSTKIQTVYDNQNIEETAASKEKFISSITQFILNRSFYKSKSESNFSIPEEKQKSEEVIEKPSEKSEFISSIEKIINSKTKDLYQYSEEKPPAKEELPVLISAEDLDKYKITKEYSANKFSSKMSKRKNSENILSDGEVSQLSSNSFVPQKIRGRICKRSQPDILEHLKKYEQNIPEKSTCQTPCLCNYEMKPILGNYIPKFRRSMFFPAASTQTSSTDFNFKAGFNDNLLSDGEIQNISTDLSEDEF